MIRNTKEQVCIPPASQTRRQEVAKCWGRQAYVHELATLQTINWKPRKEAKFEPLASMEGAATIGSFQGRGCNIVAVVMGTTKAGTAPGPGCTIGLNRLDFFCSRHMCEMLIVDDLGVTRDLELGQGRGTGSTLFKVNRKDKDKDLFKNRRDNGTLSG